MRAILLLLHISGGIVWVGGMFFAHFCLRSVAALQLPGVVMFVVTLGAGFSR